MKSSTRVTLAALLILGALYMAIAGLIVGKVLSWGNAGPEYWHGRAALMAGIGWLSLAVSFTLALVHTNQTTKTDWMMPLATMCLVLFFLFEIAAHFMAQPS